jgi:flagellar hook-length control protein FliK
MAAAPPEIGSGSRESGAGPAEESPDAEDADKNPMQPFGPARGKVLSEYPEFQAVHLPPQHQVPATSGIVPAGRGSAPAFSAGDPRSSGAAPLETKGNPRWAASPAQDDFKNQRDASSAALGDLSFSVQSPTAAASAHVDAAEPLPCPETQAEDGLRFSEPVNPNEAEGETERRHAPEAIKKAAGNTNVTAAVPPDQAAAGVWLQAAMFPMTGTERAAAPITGEGGQSIRIPLVKSQPDTPKLHAPQSQNGRPPAKIEAKSEEAETAVAIAPGVSSTQAAAQRHETTQTMQRGGKESLAPSSLHEPLSVSPSTSTPFSANITAPAGSAKFVLKLVETVIKGGEVPAPAPFHDGSGIRFQSGQASALKFKLHPVELGEVQVTMRVSNDRVFIDVSVENAEAYDALMRNGEEITAKLAGLGLPINQVTIHNSQAGGSSASQNPTESHEGPRQDNGQRFDSRDAPKDQSKRSDDDNASFETEYGKNNMPASRPLHGLGAERRSIYI